MKYYFVTKKFNGRENVCAATIDLKEAKELRRMYKDEFNNARIEIIDIEDDPWRTGLMDKLINRFNSKVCSVFKPSISK